MALALQPPSVVGVTLLLFNREVSARLASPWFYGVATALCVIAWLYGAGFLQSFQTESVIVTTDPLATLNFLIIAFLGVILGLRLASSFAWERENRTLEVLIVGPVSYAAVVLSKFGVELCVLALLVAIYVAYLLLAQPLGAGVISPSDALSAAGMPISALPLLALGLIVSALVRSVRMAVVVFLSIVTVLALIEVGTFLLESRPPDQLSLAELYIRSGLDGASRILDPASAVARLADVATAQDGIAAVTTAWALALTVVTLALAVLAARARGALE